MAPPPRIAFFPAFVFDLQRFALTDSPSSDSVFSVTNSSGTKYGTASEFTTANLTESGITEIKLFGDVTLADNIGDENSKVAATINVTENATLDLKGKKLYAYKNNSGSTGIQVESGKTFTVNDSDTSGTGEIIHEAYNNTNKTAKENRPGDGQSENVAIKLADNASFVMNGGTITSESVSIYAKNGTNIAITNAAITSNKSIAVYFDSNGKDTGQNALTLNDGSTLTSKGVLPTIQVGGQFKEVSTRNTITINSGAKVEYAQDLSDTTYANNNPAGKRSQGAIFASGQTALTIKDGATVTSSHVGIEFRGGVLNVEDGTIESTTQATDETAMGLHGTARGASFTEAVAIAVSKRYDTSVNISGGTISGYVALAVANPDDATTTTTVNVTGGTLTSTAPTTTKEGIETSQADNGSGTGVTQYNLKGRNAILNLDKNVTVALSNTEVIGSVAAVTTGRTGTGYDIASGNNFSNFTFPDNSELVSFYKVTGSTDDFAVNVLGANQNWNVKNGAKNTWVYIVSSGSGEGAVATLAPATATGDDATTVLKLTTATSEGTTIPLDLTAKTFEELTTFTTLDASAAANNFALNITGNDYLTSIVGGSGADSLKAVNTGGVTLNGGTGNDSLIGGDGADTFIFSGGSDTIQDYVYGKDAVSLGADFKLPTSFASINNSDSSNFVLAVGETASLTFRPIAELQIAQGKDTFSYTAKSIALDNANSHGISLGAGWTSDFNGTKEAYENYATIDAKEVKTAIKITGNDKANSIVGGTGGGTLLGGDNDDTLVAGGGSTTLNGGEGDDVLQGGGGKDLFIYTEGKDSIGNYTANSDLISVRGVNLAEATVSSPNNDLILTFDDNNALSIADGASADDSSAISIQSGKNVYSYTKDYYALNDKSITLMADYSKQVGDVTTFDGSSRPYATINAAAVTTTGGISINGNENDNYIIGSETKSNTLDGGAGDDTLVGGTVSAADLFKYSEGKDVIENFNATDDKLSITDALIGSIKSGKATSNKLTFTINNKSDVLTFNFGDSDIDSVSVQGGGYLTKDGYVNKDNALTLFSSAKGNITVGTGLYSGVSTVDAEAVKKQGVTLVGGEGGLYKFNSSNKQKDGFTYVGGTVSISGYEGGRDRIDLGAASISNFEITSGTEDVVLNLGEGKSISIKGAQGEEVLLRENNKNFKLVFKADGVLENKAKNPTMATVSADYTASGKVKKIFVADGTTGIKLQAGNNNTVIDASKAGGVSLSGGNKNDKLIGSSAGDVFIYGAGKDIIQGFGSSDSISLTMATGKSLQDSLTSAKITKSNSTIKFKFDNKNTLTIKADKENTTFKNGKLQINGTNYTYQKNAVQNGGTVSLTSSFGGTFKTLDATQQTIDGGLVKNNLTFVGSTRDEKFIGSDENKKTTFKGGGGNDTLVGGASKDTFFYAKSYTGDAEIQSFDFAKDKLKVASGKIGSISSISGGSGGIQIGMTSGQKNSSAIVGSFKITSQKGDTTAITPDKVAFKANNTYYWFNQENDVKDIDGNSVELGALITADTRVSNIDASYSVIDLNYSTNLAKSGVAVKVTGATPKPKT